MSIIGSIVVPQTQKNVMNRRPTLLQILIMYDVVDCAAPLNTSVGVEEGLNVLHAWGKLGNDAMHQTYRSIVNLVIYHIAMCDIDAQLEASLITQNEANTAQQEAEKRYNFQYLYYVLGESV